MRQFVSLSMEEIVRLDRNNARPDSDYAESLERAQKVRRLRKKRAAEKAGATLPSGLDALFDDERDGLDPDAPMSWTRKLPDSGMLVNGDYALHAHFHLIKRLTGGAKRLCFYTEKEPGMSAALMAAFRDEVLTDRLEAFQVKVSEELSTRRKWSLVGKSKAEFRGWLKARRADGTITTQDLTQVRMLRLLEALRDAQPIEDARLQKTGILDQASVPQCGRTGSDGATSDVAKAHAAREVLRGKSAGAQLP